MTQAQRSQEFKYHKSLAQMYRSVGQEGLAKIEEDIAAKIIRASFKEQAKRP